MSDAQAALQRIHAAALAAVQRGINPGILEGCARILEAAAWGVTPESSAMSAAAPTAPPVTGPRTTHAKPKREIQWRDATHHALGIVPRLLGRKVDPVRIAESVRTIFHDHGESEPSPSQVAALIEEARLGHAARSAAARRAWDKPPEKVAAWKANIRKGKKKG